MRFNTGFKHYSINAIFFKNENYTVQRLNHFSALMYLWCMRPVANSSMQPKCVLTAPPFGKWYYHVTYNSTIYKCYIYTLYT